MCTALFIKLDAIFRKPQLTNMPTNSSTGGGSASASASYRISASLKRQKSTGTHPSGHNSVSRQTEQHQQHHHHHDVNQCEITQKPGEEIVSASCINLWPIGITLRLSLWTSHHTCKHSHPIHPWQPQTAHTLCHTSCWATFVEPSPTFATKWQQLALLVVATCCTYVYDKVKSSVKIKTI